MKLLLVVALSLGAMSLSALAQSKEVEAERGKALAAAMSEYLMAFYTCQRYTGIEQYLAAKSISTNLYERVVGDRNEAVLRVDMLDKKIKSMSADQRLEAQFDKDGTSKSDRSDFCYEITEEAKSKFEVEQAKNQLL